MTAASRTKDYLRPYRRHYEARQADAGRGAVHCRLSAAAYAQLERLRLQHHCSTRDVIEALLFGNIPTPNAHRLSPAERECAKALGVSL
jgi:hypothetical protein